MKANASQQISNQPDPGALRHRLRGLRPQEAAALRRAMQLLAEGDRLLSGQLLLQLSQSSPHHPEVLHWCGVRHCELGEWVPAAACLARAAALRPDGFETWLLLARAQDQAGDHAAAQLSLGAAMRCAAGAQQCMALSVELDRQGLYGDALRAVQQALLHAPQAPLPLLQRARCHKALGNAEPAAADCRALIASRQLAAQAWFSLVDLKTVPLAADELAQLERDAAAAASPADRVLLDFALGKALEDAGRLDAAFATLQRANAAAQSTHPWDARRFARHVADVQAAFSAGPAASAEPQGSEVILLVGLPRSGTTLVEQVLASHSAVEGASELPSLNQVIDEESARRGQPFPTWVASATAADWTALGQRYLQLTARWRTTKPKSTDKLPENWLLAGAALAMLPDARVIDCRRDAVETCWSCYKQLFGPGRVGFTYSFEDLAAYFSAYDGLCCFWAGRHPARFRLQHYEALVAQPQAQIRALLDFCGLPFEPQCLQFHTAQRAIRTPSALQVRRPLAATSTPAAGYGALLAPLRQLLAAAPAAAAAAAR